MGKVGNNMIENRRDHGQIKICVRYEIVQVHFSKHDYGKMNTSVRHVDIMDCQIVTSAICLFVCFVFPNNSPGKRRRNN